MSDTSNQIGKIGSEEWANKKVQNIVSTKPTSIRNIKIPTSVPRGISEGVSSIGPAKRSESIEEYTPLRPALSSPTVSLEEGKILAVEQFVKEAHEIALSEANPEVKQSYLLTLVKLQQIVEEVAARHVKHMSHRIKNQSADLEALNAKKTEEIRKYALEVQKAETWSTFARVAQYFLSAASIVLGSMVVASGVGTVAGSCIIAAGGLSLVHQIGKDTNAFQSVLGYLVKSKELQQEISTWISSTILFATIGLGLYGGISGNLTQGIEAVSGTFNSVKAAQRVEFAIGLATAGSNTQKSYKELQASEIKKSLQILESKIFLIKQDLQKSANEGKLSIEFLQSIVQATRTSIAAFG
jgi:hypothetical protein